MEEFRVDGKGLWRVSGDTGYLVISKEEFITCFNAWIKDNEDPNKKWLDSLGMNGLAN